MDPRILAGIIGLIISSIFLGIHVWRFNLRKKVFERSKSDKKFFTTLTQNVWLLIAIFFLMAGLLSFASMIGV